MAAAFDAKSASQNGLVSSVTLTLAHTVGASGTVLFVFVAMWAQQNPTTECTGVTYNSVAMTKIGVTAASNANDVVYIWGLAGPATGTHNVVATLNTGGTQNAGSVYAVSFSGTATTGTPWADFTSTATTVAAANSSISVPNNTANDGIIDCVALGAAATPTMGTQTNRTLGASGNGGGEGEGWSYLAPAPSSGSQTMNWTFASTSSAQAGVRVIGSGGAATKAPAPFQARLRRATRIRRY